MHRFVRSLAPALIALAATASLASAQTAPAAPPAAGAGPGAHHQRPTAETMQRLEDGRFAMIKGSLKLTDAQLKLWQPVEDLLRAQHAQRVKAMQDFAAKPHDANAPRPTLADRLERRSTMMVAQADRIKALAAVLRPFDDSLTAEQKAVAGPLMAELNGGQGMRGHRFADRQSRGDHRGPGPQ